MSLSKFFHTQHYFDSAAEYDCKKGREYFGNAALDYAKDHEEYSTTIEKNLGYFDLPDDADAVENAIRNIGFHYHEKFLAFVKDPHFYPDFFKEVACPKDTIYELLNNQEDREPTLILCTHYGAMPLVVGTFNYHQMAISAVVRFPSPEFKKQQEDKLKQIRRTLNSGRLTFIQPDEQMMTKVSSTLAQGRTLYTVIDEHTSSSKTIEFLGKKITGGAGVDSIIEMVGHDTIKVYFSIMVREGDSYRLDIHQIDTKNTDYIQDVFSIYEKYVADAYEQWFFLQEVHENIPE